MIKCPHCDKQIDIEAYVTYNVLNYQQSAVARTNCCSELVYVDPIRRVNVSKYIGTKTKDDWGK